MQNFVCFKFRRIIASFISLMLSRWHIFVLTRKILNMRMSLFEFFRHFRHSLKTDVCIKNKMLSTTTTKKWTTFEGNYSKEQNSIMRNEWFTLKKNVFVSIEKKNSENRKSIFISAFLKKSTYWNIYMTFNERRERKNLLQLK